MKIVDPKKVSISANPHGVDARTIYDTENAQIVYMTLKPGESLKKHITPVDVFFYVLEGKGLLEIGDEQQEIGADTLIDSPKGIPHQWHNRSQDVLKILVGKVPRQKEPTRIL